MILKNKIKFLIALSFVSIMGSLLLPSSITIPIASAEVYEDLQFLTPVSTISSPQNSNVTNATTTASVPDISKGPPIPSKGYLVEEIRDGLYWITDGVYNTMFLVSDQGVTAIDAPPSIGENYIKAIKEVTDKPIQYVIYSHSHVDHIGAAGSIFPNNVTYIAQEETANLLKEANDTRRPVPTVTFTDHYELNSGNQTLELDYKGVNHEPGNIYIYAPKQKTLMLVDVIFPGWSPFKELGITTHVPGFVKAHDTVLGYDFDTFVGGHLTRLGTSEDVILQKQFVNDLTNASMTANSNFDFGSFAQKYGMTNPWLVIEEYYNAVTNDCTDTMNEKWKDRLGGWEEFMNSHCWKMTESLRVD